MNHKTSVYALFSTLYARQLVPCPHKGAWEDLSRWRCEIKKRQGSGLDPGTGSRFGLKFMYELIQDRSSLSVIDLVSSHKLHTGR